MGPYWTAAELKTAPTGVASAHVCSAVADAPLSSSSMAYLQASALLGGRAVLSYLELWRLLLKQQEEFWLGVLPADHIRNCEIVPGGGPLSGKQSDSVRGERLTGAAQDAIFRVVCPLVTSALFDWSKDYTSLADVFFPAIDSMTTLRSFVGGLAPLISNLKLPRSRVKFADNLRVARRKLLLPLGGPISHDIVFNQLFNTQGQRHYTLVARVGDSDTPVSLDRPENIVSIRALKADILQGNQTAAPDSRYLLGSKEPFLDQQLRYEIWERESATSKALRPLVQPHIASNADDHYVHDAMYVLATPRDASRWENANDGQWILSLQPLHPYATAAVELYWRPEMLLKDCASEFQKQASAAFMNSNGAGFEAVLEVKGRRSSPDESPRNFQALPSLENIFITVAGPPRPLERTE